MRDDAGGHRRWSTVLFDLDHTLLDSDTSHRAAFETTMRSVGIEPSEDVYAVFDRLNQALWRRVERGEIGPNDVKVRRFEQMTDELGVEADPEEMGRTFVDALAEHGELYAGAHSLLDRLSGQRRVAMITNGIGSVQRGRIERLQIGSFFEAIAISGELGIAKPDAAIFDHVLDELGVSDRREVVMVGDSLTSDVAGATNAGVDSIWFSPNGDHSSEPTHVARSIDDIGRLLG